MPADQVAEVRIRCYSDVPECEVVVAVRGKEIILRCPDYDQAVKWARVECRSYGIASITAEHDQQSHAGSHAVAGEDLLATPAQPGSVLLQALLDCAIIA